jgi:hypothetical protein
VGGALALLAVLAGWREVTAALEHAAAPGSMALGQVAFLCAAAVAAGATALRVGGTALRGFALAILGAAVLRGFVGLREAVDPLRTALLVILPCGAADALARLSPRGDASVRAFTNLALLGAAALWGTLLHAGRLPSVVLVANPRFVAGVVVAVGFALVRRRAAAGSGGADASRLALLCAVLMAYAVGLFEVFDLVRPLESAQWRSVFVSVYSTLYAAGVLALGFRLRAADLRWVALAGLGAVIVKVGAHDLTAVETPFRILVTGCLGVVLLVAAYAYARRDKAGARSQGS